MYTMARENAQNTIDCDELGGPVLRYILVVNPF